MATIKAERVKDGDKILLPDGSIATVKGARTTERKIPARKVKHSLITMEVRGKSNGRTTLSHLDMFTTADDTIEVIERDGFAWKRDKFIAKYKGYINAFTATVVGGTITTILTATEVVTPLTGGTMLILTGLLGVALTVYAYLNK
jgi:hypothetical protein